MIGRQTPASKVFEQLAYRQFLLGEPSIAMASEPAVVSHAHGATG